MGSPDAYVLRRGLGGETLSHMIGFHSLQMGAAFAQMPKAAEIEKAERLSYDETVLHATDNAALKEATSTWRHGPLALRHHKPAGIG